MIFVTFIWGLVEPYIVQIVSGVVLLAALAAGWLYFEHKYYTEGYTAAIAAVEKINKEAANAVRDQWKKVEDCYSANGTWDESRGVCN